MQHFVVRSYTGCALSPDQGLVWFNRNRRTLLDMMLAHLSTIAIGQPFYFVGDAYSAAGKIIGGLLAQNNHLISRVRSNAVAYLLFEPVPGKFKPRGRPKTYGRKVLLNAVPDDLGSIHYVASPVYSEQNVTIDYGFVDLFWRPVGCLVRFVVVVHPIRGRCILMTTDTSLVPFEIIHIYVLRFKIDFAFKQAVQVIGSFC